LPSLILFVIQQVDSFLDLSPSGRDHPLGYIHYVVLMAVSIGGYYAGLVGMILAVPIAGIIQIFIRRWAAAKENEKEKEEEES
jgi:predicted PurR-regulated permease PerM